MITSVIRIKEYLNKIQIIIKRYDKGNWGYPFFAGFMVLLFLAAIFLASGLGYWAELTANIAYFALATGVVFQLVYLSVKKRKTSGVILDGSN